MTSNNQSDKYNVLVVEDEQISLEMLQRILETNEKINTFTAKTGKQALELFHKHRIDCTLLDVGLPKMNGIEVLEKIKEINPYAKVIMQTSSSDKETVKQSILLGAASYIVKPYEPEKILETLDDLLL